MKIDELQVPGGLTARAFGLYMYAYCQGGGQFTIAGLAEVFGDGRTSIGTAVTELVERDLARPIEYKGEQGLRRTAFLLDSHFGPSAIVVDEG